jgi:hypothetical protein
MSTSNKPESSKQRLKELVISASSSTINSFAFFTCIFDGDVDGDDLDDTAQCNVIPVSKIIYG